MKESAVIALEYLKAHSNLIGLEQAVFDTNNIHVHVPEGATPKDGPSAGVGMVTSIISAITETASNNIPNSKNLFKYFVNVETQLSIIIPF